MGAAGERPRGVSPPALALAVARIVIVAPDLLFGSRIEGEMILREVREGRAEIVEGWGRPESVREEFRQRRSL